jgi:hypothetical protein
MTEKTSHDESVISEDSTGTARLLMKVMTKKLNEKYGDVLNEQQKSMIKAYAYSTASSDNTSIKLKLNEVKNCLLERIDVYCRSEESPNGYLKNKLEETRTMLQTENFDLVDDTTVTRFMLYSRLNDELDSKE